MSPRPKAGYRLADGRRVSGVTTVIKQIGWNAEPLKWWAFRAGQQHPDLSSPYEVVDQAADIGTAVHAGIEQALHGLPDDDVQTFVAGELEGDEQVEKALKALGGFFQWRDMVSLEPVEQEVSLVSETYEYGGTLDLVARVGGKLALVDWKTSGGIYRETLIQLAAYGELWDENHVDRPLDGGYYCLRVDKQHGGFEFRFWPEVLAWWPPFEYALELKKLDKALKL